MKAMQIQTSTISLLVLMENLFPRAEEKGGVVQQLCKMPRTFLELVLNISVMHKKQEIAHVIAMRYIILALDFIWVLI